MAWCSFRKPVNKNHALVALYSWLALLARPWDAVFLSGIGRFIHAVFIHHSRRPPEDKQDVQRRRNRVGNHGVRGAGTSLWGKLGAEFLLPEKWYINLDVRCMAVCCTVRSLVATT